MPKSFCATFEADDYTCDCQDAGGRLSRAGSTYSGSVTCKGETLDILLEIVVRYGECQWHLVSEFANVDEYFDMRGEYGVGCENPVFEFEAAFYDCAGVVTIQRYDGAKVEFSGCDYFCGSCRCTCNALCVIEYEDGVPKDPITWAWDPEKRGWGDPDYEGASLQRAEDGSCLLVVDGQEFPIDDLCQEISADTVDEYGNGYVLTCWECACAGASVICCPGNVPTSVTVYFNNYDSVADEYTAYSGVLVFGNDSWVGVVKGGWWGVETQAPIGDLEVTFRCDSVDTFGIELRGVNGPGDSTCEIESNATQQIPPGSCDPVLASLGNVLQQVEPCEFNGIYDVVVTE